MSVVAMTREMGSLGTYIAMEAARRLGYECIREDITREAAREYQILEERLVSAVEDRPGLLEAVTRSTRRYQAFVAAEVLDTALKDRVVIVGRWSAFLLAGVRHAVRVRVCASLDTRVARIMQRLGADQEEARRRVQASDDGVRARIRQVFDTEWSDPPQYDLTISTDHVRVETAAADVVNLAGAPEFQPIEESRRELENRALAARVVAALKADRETAWVEIQVRADRGSVRLAGTVDREGERESALRIARAVRGVTVVESEVRVISAPPR